MTKHTDTHETLSSLEDYGYTGLDDRMKVTYMMDGIKFAPMEACRMQILATTALRSDFDAAAALYRDTHLSMEAEGGAQRRNISDLRSRGVEDRYYADEEFKKLSEDQVTELYRMRDERGDASKKKANSKKKSAQKQAEKVKNQRDELKTSKRKIKKLNARIAKLTSAAADDNDESSESSGELGAARR